MAPLSNAFLCVKTFGITEPYRELIYIPTPSELENEDMFLYFL